MTISVTPILPIRERKSDNEVLQARNPIDSKVRGFVLERISQAKGGLLPSTTAPQIVIDLLPAFESGRAEHPPRPKRKSKLRKSPFIRLAPIGLLPADSDGWINALMQFILFVPGFAELFFFAPRSFYPFQEFIDQYHNDQQENRALSSANGAALFRFLSFKIPNLNPHEIFHFLLQSLHPHWTLHHSFDSSKDPPSDLFLTEPSLKKQHFSPPRCYDLDAFIEIRPDGPSANFITYVKVDGIWYQCDDIHITLLRSNSLTIPLSRSILSHYRRIM